MVFNQKKVVGSIVGGRHDMVEMLEFAAVKVGVTCVTTCMACGRHAA